MIFLHFFDLINLSNILDSIEWIFLWMNVLDFVFNWIIFKAKKFQYGSIKNGQKIKKAAMEVVKEEEEDVLREDINRRKARLPGRNRKKEKEGTVTLTDWWQGKYRTICSQFKEGRYLQYVVRHNIFYWSYKNFHNLFGSLSDNWFLALSGEKIALIYLYNMHFFAPRIPTRR